MDLYFLFRTTIREPYFQKSINLASNFTEKTFDLSESQTWIVIIEGKHADQ